MHQTLLDWIRLFEPYVDQYGYLVLFVGVMAENAALPVPGETILIIAAFYSSPSYGSLHLGTVIGIATIAAILGDNISFYIGRHYGRPFLGRYGKYLLITPRRLSKVEAFFERHGEKTIFFQRWITGVRVIGALVAGSSHMPWSRFLWYNCLGAVAWVTVIAVLGYVFAVNIIFLAKFLERSSITLLILFVLVGFIVMIKKRLKVTSGPRP